MEISIFDINEKNQIDFFKKSFKGHKINFYDKSIQNIPTIKFKKSEVVIVFIYSNITKYIIDRLPKLKCILTQSTGFDHIDINYAKLKSIEVGYVPFYGENTVAEHTFALILNLSRKVHKSYLRTMENNFEIDGLRGFDLKGKTLGIIGVGHIGLHVIRMAKGFGMHVKAFDISEENFLSEVMHFNYTSLDEILTTSDIITLHMPINKSTYHFLDEKKIKKTKKGIYIINTSRGGLIDTNILYKYLKNGHIGGLGLDVIEGEAFISHEEELIDNPNKFKDLRQVILDEKIFKMENVIFTPHNAFNSKEAILRIMQTTIDNLISFNSKKEVKFSVFGK